jgi:hypothetical protein
VAHRNRKWFANTRTAAIGALLVVLGAGAGPTAQAQLAPVDDYTGLAKRQQNPIGGLTSIELDNSTNFNVPPPKAQGVLASPMGTQDTLNILVNIPIQLNEDWNLITQAGLPLEWPEPQGGPFGLGASTFLALLSPSRPLNGWSWGAGPIIQIPTITSKKLDSNVWGVGPAAVVSRIDGALVYGVQISNVFSLGGTSGQGGTPALHGGTSFSMMMITPAFYYNFSDGWFVGTNPTITADWMANGAKWVLPVGALAGRVIVLGGKLPVYLQVGAYYNALRPQGTGTWELATQVAIIF